MVREGHMYLIPEGDELREKPFPYIIKSLINNILINNGSFNYNTCYININTSEVERFRGRMVNGVKIKTYNCLPVNTYWFVKEFKGI